jgi:8-oxo-dGTP pyrophosphatase MutT (NUDIX family)
MRYVAQRAGTDRRAGGHRVDHDTYRPQTFSISIKGVVVRDGKVLLLRNERKEWELPGGRIEVGETPEECVAREIFEETQCKVETGPILDTWMYYINVAEKNVFIVTYGCYPIGNTQPVLSHEHKEIGLFSESEVASLVMPGGYKRSIAAWHARLRDNASGLTE